MEYNVYSYLIPLLFLGACNGIIFSVILFFHKRGNKTANKLLAVLVMIMSLSLAESLIVLSGTYKYVPHLISVTFPLHFLLGPLYYFYIKFRLNQVRSFKPLYLLHLLPLVVAFFDQLPFYLSSAQGKIDHLDTILTGGEMVISARIFTMMAFKIIQIGAYIFYSWKALFRFEQNIKNYHSDEAKITFQWIKKFSKWFTIYLGTYLAVFILLAALDSYSVFIDNLIFLGEAIFVLTVGFYAIRKPEIYSGPVLKSTLTEKYEKSSLTEEESTTYARELINLMETEKPYRKSDLRLPDLAERLSVSTNHLSQVLNQELGMSFFEFVNRYRVDEAKKKLIHPDYRHLTFLAIAYEVGFSSKASFNRVFKKFTGQTPSSFVNAKKRRKA